MTNMTTRSLKPFIYQGLSGFFTSCRPLCKTNFYACFSMITSMSDVNLSVLA